MYRPKDEKLRVEISQLHHSISITGHGEKQKTTELVMRNYWWSGVTKDVGKYMEECNLCQKMKNRTKVLVKKLKLSEILEKPQTYLIVDFITKLPLVAGKNAILVVCDRLSKMTYFVAITEETLAEVL